MNQRIKVFVEYASKGNPSHNEFAEHLAQLVAEDCAQIARNYILNSSGLNGSYKGEVMIQNEILKLYASDSSEFIKMKENVE